MPTWNNREPIYRQLAHQLIGRLIDGEPPEGEALPSVRVLAQQFVINPITVQRALQELSDDGVLEARRGLGLYVKPGAREQLRQLERKRFLQHEWPALRERLRRMGFDADALTDLQAP